MKDAAMGLSQKYWPRQRQNLFLQGPDKTLHHRRGDYLPKALFAICHGTCGSDHPPKRCYVNPGYHTRDIGGKGWTQIKE